MNHCTALRLKVRAALVAVALCGGTGAAAETPRQELLEQYEANYRAGDFESALTDAQQLLDQARASRNRRPASQVVALSKLARAHLALSNTVAAETHFLEAIALGETSLGTSNRHLVEPLAGLGQMYADMGRHQDAVATLERALIVSRRNSGLFDLSQAELLQQLADSHTEIGGFEEARRHIDYLRGVVDRAYDTRSPKIVPTMNNIADWYSEIGDPLTARLIYRQSIDIIQRTYGKDSPQLTEPLRGFARTYVRELSMPRFQEPKETTNFSINSAPFVPEPLEPRIPLPRNLSNEGEKALQRAVKLSEQDAVPAELLRAALLELGDWYQIKEDTKRAMNTYGRVVDIEAPTPPLANKEDTDQFGFPVRLYYPTPPGALRHLHRSPDDVRERYVVVEFTVTEAGDVANAKVVEEDANNRQVSETLSAISAARYRPRLVDGKPVATTGVRHRQVFRTLK